MANIKSKQKDEQIWLARQIVSQKTDIFKTKFKEQVSTAIITAFGLVVALAWKDVIVDFVTKINPAESNLIISAILVTVIAIIGISIVSKWAKTPSQNKLS